MSQTKQPIIQLINVINSTSVFLTQKSVLSPQIPPELEKELASANFEKHRARVESGAET